MRDPTAAEFDDLLVAALDGPPDADRNARLCEVLRRRPELQADYLELMQLHAMLLWREGRVIPALDAAPTATVQASTPRAEAVPPGAGSSRRRWMSRAAAVAAAGLAFGLLIGLSFQPERAADNGSEVVERLVSWDLDIAQAPTKDQRQTIHDMQAPTMRGLLATVRLGSEDRDLAQTLVETSSWLTQNDDPVAEAERFSAIADQLLERLDSATASRDDPRMTAFADSYRRVAEVGVSVNLDRAVAAGGLDPRRKPKLDRLLAGEAGRDKRLEDLLDRHPDASWKAIHRASKGHHRKTNPPKPQN